MPDQMLGVQNIGYKRGSAEFLSCLALVSPGSELREGLDHIVHAGLGALIVLGDEGQVLDDIEGGFELDCEFSPTRLYELAKMDGAILLSTDHTRILRANVYVRTHLSILTRETGMRHQAAERLAKHAGGVVIAVSQRRGTVTLYSGRFKYVLPQLTVLMAGANQTLLTLDLYMGVLKQALTQLHQDEIEQVVNLAEVLSVIQRVEMVRRAEEELNRYRIELGNQAQALQLRHPAVTSELSEGLLVVRDYLVQGHLPEEEIYQAIFDLSAEELSDRNRIGVILGYNRAMVGHDELISPRGYRILSKIRQLPPVVTDNVVQKFQNLGAIAQASVEALQQVDGVGEVRASLIRKELRVLRAERR